MSKAEILELLPKLDAADRAEIMDALHVLNVKDADAAPELTQAEKEMLDRELERYKTEPETFRSWDEVKRSILNGSAREA